jgi:hypothetical protein
MDRLLASGALVLMMTACGQMEPLDGNRIPGGFDAGAGAVEPVADAGAVTDAGDTKPDTGPADTGIPRPADDHSDSRVGGSRLSPGQGIAGLLDGDSDSDWFVFTAGVADLHRVETRGQTDTKCGLYDADGDPVADDDDSGDALNCRMEQALVSGADYYVQVEHFSASGTGDYMLFIEAISAPAVAPEFSADPLRVAAGEPVNLTGTGFTAMGSARFVVSSGGLQPIELEAVAGEDGSVTAVWQTARSTRAGAFRIEATDQASGLSSRSVEVTVTTAPVDDHADERAGATGIRTGRFTPGEIHESNDVDWFRFRTQSAGQWVISTRGDLDTTCALYLAGEEVTNDDDSGDALNCRIERSLQANRDYFVKVESFGTRTGNYELVVVPPPTPDDHGNTIETSSVLGSETSTSGSIGSAGDVDVFGFTAQFTGVYQLRTVGISDTMCRLLSLRGAELDSDDNSGILWNCEIERRLDAGTTYFFAISHSDAEGTGSYWFFLSAPEGSPSDDHGNGVSAATLIGDHGSTPGVIELDGDRDYFQFFASRDGDWTIETSSDVDTVCQLLSDDGAQIASNDDAGDDRNCRMTARLVGGTRYAVEVRLFGAGRTGAYRLRLTPP